MAIVEAMRAEGIGRDAVDGALDALEAAGVVEVRRDGRGGTKHFRMAGADCTEEESAAAETPLPGL